jgi:Na+-translocating ferredoxin:NAD+ oxidoreductase subunit D
MTFIHQCSPHTHSGARVQHLMVWLLLALLPGLAAQVWLYGPGNLANAVVLMALCAGFEAGFLALRKKPIKTALFDGSALVTGALLAVSLPPYCPFWLLVAGAFFAIVLAKQLYGGLGFNPFNPAMVAYVILLVSFPVPMTQWPQAESLLPHGASTPSIYTVLHSWFGSTVEQLGLGLSGYDALTGATSLDLIQHKQGNTLDVWLNQQQVFNQAYFAASGSEWVNLGFLCGGLVLWVKRVFTWHAPAAFLTSLGVLAAFFYDAGSSQSPGSPLIHWFSGGTMLGAFFIITDPVTSAVSPKGRLVFGALIGCLVYVIRAWGNYPDAIAFAVLFGNFAAPFIDFFTVPKTYGHNQAPSAKRFFEP